MKMNEKSVYFVISSICILTYYFLGQIASSWTDRTSYRLYIEQLESRKERITPLKLDSNQIEYVNCVFFDSIKSNVTLITAVYDLHLKDEPISQYYEWLNKTLMINKPFVIFTELKSRRVIKAMIPINVVLVFVELNELPLYHTFDVVDKLITNQRGMNPEARNSFHSLVMFSKFEFINVTANLINPFVSSKFVWIDVGVGRFNIDRNQELTFNQIANGLITVVLESDANYNKHHRVIWLDKSLIRTDIMSVGSGRVATEMNKEMIAEWVEMLRQEEINSDRVRLGILYSRYPSLFNMLNVEQNWKDIVNLLK